MSILINIGNTMMNIIWRNYPDFWENRAVQAPDTNTAESTYNQDTGGVLNPPTEGQIRGWGEARARPEKVRPQNTT